MMIIAGREYLQCNSNHTDKMHYQSKVRKMTLAKMTAANYQDAVSGVSGAGRSTKDVPYFEDSQREREKMAKAQVEKLALEKYFRAEEMTLVRVKPTLRRMITPQVRKALVDSLIACRGRKITSRGDMTDIFLTGDPVMSYRCCKYLLRMIFMLPPDLACVGILKENLLTFAQLSEETSSMRQLEWDWAWKLLNVIKILKTTQSCESAALIYSMARLNKTAWEEGDVLGYVFGNLNMRTSIMLMLSQEKAREDALNPSRETPRKERAEFMRDWNEQTLAHILRKERLEGETEGNEHGQRGEEPEVVHGEEQGVEEPEDVAGEEPGPSLHTPAKQWDSGTARRMEWNDRMKIELLRVWIQKTANPMVRADRPKGKSEYKTQMRPLLQEGVGILVGDERLKLSSFVSDIDTLAQMLQGTAKGKGLSGQRGKDIGKCGLVSIIDEFLENKEDKSVNFVRAHCQDILDFAKDHYCL